MKVFTHFFLGFLIQTAAWAQTVDKNEDFEPAPAPIVGGPSGDFAPDLKEQKEKFLNVLKTEIEPNLIKTDADKLNRNVMRLGSYRRDWVEKAREFLLANAALAELYLYRYSILKNTRLNKEILETLIAFPTYRFPRAALAFVDTLSMGQKARFTKLLEKTAGQEPAMNADILKLLASNFGKDIPLENRLLFSAKACGKSPSTVDPDKELLFAWIQQSQNVWERVSASELSACLKGV